MVETVVEEQALRNLVPLCDLTTAQRRELAFGARRERVEAGTHLGIHAVGPGRLAFLVDGAIELHRGEETVATLMPGSAAARVSLCQQGGSPDGAVALVDSTLLSVDRARVSALAVLTAALTVNQRDPLREGAQADEEWAARLLRSELFAHVSPVNLYRLSRLVESVRFRAGESVARQGDPAEHFYIVRIGAARLTYRGGDDLAELQLGTLEPGDTFGEEVLVEGALRPASVETSCNSVLWRVGRDGFGDLLTGPILDEIDRAEAEQIVAAGGHWLDVRAVEEFQQNGIDGAQHVTLAGLLSNRERFQEASPIVVYGNGGARASAAAFALSEVGVTAYVLAGGLLGTGPAQGNAAPRQRARGLPAQLVLAKAALEAAAAAGEVAPGDQDGAHAEAVRVAREHQLALETEMAEAEGIARAQRRKVEATVERLRRESAERLTTEHERTCTAHEEVAAELRRLDAERRRGEARFQAYGRRLAGWYREQMAKLEAPRADGGRATAAEIERVDRCAQQAKEKANSELARTRSEHGQRERRVREDAGQRLEAAHRRFESELALTLLEQQRVRRRLADAEAQARADRREADRVGAELDAAARQDEAGSDDAGGIERRGRSSGGRRAGGSATGVDDEFEDDILDRTVMLERPLLLRRVAGEVAAPDPAMEAMPELPPIEVPQWDDMELDPPPPIEVAEGPDDGLDERFAPTGETGVDHESTQPLDRAGSRPPTSDDEPAQLHDGRSTPPGRGDEHGPRPKMDMARIAALARGRLPGGRSSVVPQPAAKEPDDLQESTQRIDMARIARRAADARPGDAPAPQPSVSADDGDYEATRQIDMARVARLAAAKRSGDQRAAAKTPATGDNEGRTPSAQADMARISKVARGAADKERARTSESEHEATQHLGPGPIARRPGRTATGLEADAAPSTRASKYHEQATQRLDMSALAHIARRGAGAAKSPEREPASNRRDQESTQPIDGARVARLARAARQARAASANANPTGERERAGPARTDDEAQERDVPERSAPPEPGADTRVDALFADIGAQLGSAEDADEPQADDDDGTETQIEPGARAGSAAREQADAERERVEAAIARARANLRALRKSKPGSADDA